MGLTKLPKMANNNRNNNNNNRSNNIIVIRVSCSSIKHTQEIGIGIANRYKQITYYILLYT